MREISSPFTFFYKYIVILIWIIGFGFGASEMLLSGPDNPQWIRYMGTWFFIAGGIYFFTGHIKKVSMDNNHLVVSNFIKQEKIPLTAIEKVDGASFLNPRLVWITLSGPSTFGEKITFIPVFRKGSAIGKHPLVYELRQELHLQ